MAMPLEFFQTLPFKTRGFSWDLMLRNFSWTLMFLGSVIKYTSFWYQRDTIKEIMEKVKREWKTEHEGTLRILQKRAAVGKQQGAIYALFIYPSVIWVTIFYLSSVYLYDEQSANGTRGSSFPLVTEYLIDDRKYGFVIAIHHTLSIFLCGTIYIATETMFIMWLQHSYSLYEVASNHIAEAIPDDSDLLTVKKELTDSYRKMCLISAVKAHTEAKVFVLEIKQKFVFSYAVLLVFAVISLSINFLRVSRSIVSFAAADVTSLPLVSLRSKRVFQFTIALQVTHDMNDMVASLFCSISELMYMFYLNYLVQQLLNFSERFCTIIYSTQWYTMSLTVQKILLIFMVKCSDPVVFSFYGFYNASIEGFSGLVRATMSYFMMLTSFQ
ncbi:uncharacterized protein LOC143174880 [Nomia melanderi]|uniref:uncharacterized protein LOC143174880 n=1 Tax=Nomia melanderi TaxID=2448451 RepID=UPI003FCD9E66